MASLPPRSNRVFQAVDALKDDISSERLKGFMPGERELAKRLRVSRITLRKAMQVLEDECWISRSKPGCRREILKHPRRNKGQDVESEIGEGDRRDGDSDVEVRGKTIVTLAPVALDQFTAKEMLDHARLNSYCSRVGITLMIRALDLSDLKRPGHRLREFLKQNPADLYLLQLCTRETQKWFYQQNVPSIVLGSPWDDAKLPYADMHQAALGTHAAHTLSRMGHRKVGMLYPDPVKSGMQKFVESFQQATPGIDLILAKENDSPESVSKALLSLVSDPVKRPTAIILPRIAYASLATGLLPSMGLKIPEHISLICLVYDEALQFLYPHVAGYSVSVDAFPKAVFNLAIKLLRHPEVRTDEHELIVPDFIAGNSIRVLD